MIEPFRAPAVDRAVLAMLGKGSAIKLDDQGRLELDTRKLLAEKVHQRLDAPARYRGKRLSLRAILQAQGRELAVFLRAEHDNFSAYVAEW
jgi:CRISPR/Cas system-associated endonuclease Cas1